MTDTERSKKNIVHKQWMWPSLGYILSFIVISVTIASSSQEAAKALGGEEIIEFLNKKKEADAPARHNQALHKGQLSILPDTNGETQAVVSQEFSFFGKLVPHWLLRVLRICLIIFCAVSLWRMVNFGVQRYFSKLKFIKKITDKRQSASVAILKTFFPIIKIILFFM